MFINISRIPCWRIFAAALFITLLSGCVATEPVAAPKITLAPPPVPLVVTSEPTAREVMKQSLNAYDKGNWVSEQSPERIYSYTDKRAQY